MQLEQVNVVRSKSAQSIFYRLYQVIARRANLVKSGAAPKSSLGRKIEVIARAPLDRTAEHLFRTAGGVNVGCIEHIDAGLKTDIDQMTRFDCIAGTPGLEEFPSSAKCA